MVTTDNSLDVYNQVLAWCTAVLVIKNVVIHLLVVRCRLAGDGKGTPVAVDLTVAPEGHPNQWGFFQWVFPVFRTSFGAFAGPLRTANDLDRLTAMEVNASQNEPFFLLLAMVWSMQSMTNTATGVVILPTWAPIALYIFTYSRIVHVILYCIFQVQPWRAMAYAVGAVTSLVVANRILMTLAEASSATSVAK